MNTEIRNELLLILEMQQSKTKEDKELKLNWLLERFENDIKTRLRDLQSKQEQLENDLAVLEYVREEIKKKEDAENE